MADRSAAGRRIGRGTCGVPVPFGSAGRRRRSGAQAEDRRAREAKGGGGSRGWPVTTKTRLKKKPLREPDDVVAEIRRRRKVGHRLISGANRGNWLYAAAVRRFGSWGAAVDAAGY